MSTEKPGRPAADDASIRWLKPDRTQIYEGTFSLLHVAVKGDTLYRGVYAVRLFPISHPDAFISLRYVTADEKDCEIGVIERLEDFPDEVQALIRAALVRHYHEQVIERIHGVEWKLGLLWFDVETQRGREQFTTYWAHDRAQDYSVNGKLLLDVYWNRYVIPDVSALPAKDRARLTRYIYW